MRTVLRISGSRWTSAPRWVVGAALALSLCALPQLALAQQVPAGPAAKPESSDPPPPPDLGELSAAELFRKGTSLVGGGSYEQAIPYLKEVLKLLRKTPDEKSKKTIEQLTLQLGVAYLGSNRYKDAAEVFEKFLQEFPQSGSRRNAQLALAEAYAAEEDWERVIKAITELNKYGGLIPSETIMANQLLGEAHFRKEQWADAVTPWLTVWDYAGEMSARTEAAAMATTAMVRSEQFTKLFSFLPRVYETPARYDYQLNIALIEGGDNRYGEDQFVEALLLYRLVYSKAAVYEQLEKRITQTRLSEAMLAKSAGIDRTTLLAGRRKLQRLLAQYGEQLLELKEQPEYMPGLTLRLGQTYAQLRRYWEAIFLYRSVYDDDPKQELAQQALYLATMTAVDMGNAAEIFRHGYEYVAAYPGGTFWDLVTIAVVQTHIPRMEFEQGLALGKKALEISPKHQMIDQMLYMMGYCAFNLEKFAEALTCFARVRDEFKDSYFLESCVYWHATTQLYMSHFHDARAEFAAFVKEYPSGIYTEDAFYRRGVSEYGDNDFAAAAETLRAFVTKYPQNALVPEALNMIGDIHAAWGDLRLAISYYEKATAAATTMVQINYATFQSARVFELERQYDKIIELMRAYVDRYGEKGNFTEAHYWIGNAQVESNHRDEALQTFFDAIVNYGSVSTNYGIDFIIRDLIYDRDQWTQAASLGDFIERLTAELPKARAAGKTTLELRLITLFAETQKDEKRRQGLIDAVLREANLKPAAPITLLMFGREARRKGDEAFARQVYAHFLTVHERSDLAMEALQQMAEIELREKQYDAALAHLRELLSRFPALSEAAEAQKRIGDIYREQKKYTEAIAAYNIVLGVKDWRGPLWPECLYSIGLCHLEQNQTEQAFAFFQRLYVMYEGYPEWAARGYLASADCLQKLNRPADAMRTYQEMISRESLAQRPELDTAREKLKQLGGGA